MSRRRLFGSLCALVFLVNLARIVYAPLLEPVMESFDVTAGTAGLLATLAWVGSASPRLPTGWLLTKVPRHYIILGTGTVLTVSATATAAAPTIEWLMVGALLMGSSSGMYFIAANPLVSELFPERVGRVLGIHGTAGQLAAVLAPVLVTAVLALTGTWRGVFLLIGAGAGVATVALFVIARRSEVPDAGSEDRELLVALRHQWPIVVSGIAIIGATGFVWNGVFNFYVTYLIDAKGVDANTGRTLLTVTFAAGVPAFWVSGRLADRLPNVPLMLTILGAFILCLFALTAVEGLLGVVAVSAAIGYVIHSLFPTLDRYLLASLPDHHRGSAYAVFSATMMLVQALGSWAVGLLTDAGFAFDVIFRGLAVGLIIILAVLLTLYVAGRLPRGAKPT